MVPKIKLTLITLMIMLLSSSIYSQTMKPIKSVSSAGKVIALTFDDGLESEIHKKMLDILKRESVPATFFMIGSKLSDKKLIKRTIKEGHEIGNHSMTHPVLPKLTMEEIKNEIIGFQKKLIKDFGYTPKVFRAPKLQYDTRVMKVLIEQNLVAVNATVGTRDFADETTTDEILYAATESPKLGMGSIILMHEVQKTLDILPDIIAFYKLKGYEFVTVSQLLGE